MTTQAVALFLAASMAAVAAAQETKVPDDSQLVSINGCARNGNFVVGERREDQPGSLEIEPGRRFRLEGAKKLLNDIKLHQRTAMQVTGLIRKIDVNGPQGVGVLVGVCGLAGRACLRVQFRILRATP